MEVVVQFSLHFSRKPHIAAANFTKLVTEKYSPILLTVYCKLNFTGALLARQVCSQCERNGNE